MTLEKELEKRGYQGTAEDFRRYLLDLLERLHPGWSDEKLLRNPRKAIRFCQAVRAEACPGMRDDPILGALLNHHKQTRWKEKRVVPAAV